MKNLLVATIFVCVLIIAYSKSAALNAMVMPLVFFVCGLGLLFEARKTYIAREVKARVPLHFWRFYRERLQSEGFVKFITIGRDKESLRFYSYVIIYGILGTFSLLASAFYLFVIFKHHFVLA